MDTQHSTSGAEATLLDIYSRLATEEEKLSNMERWQISQNGHLKQLQKDVQSINNRIAGLYGVHAITVALISYLTVKGVGG